MKIINPFKSHKKKDFIVYWQLNKFEELLTKGINDPELLIRSSGEKRISNFLLWQLAYSEIYISEVLWPDFDELEFLKAIIDYQYRNRRFGGIESLPDESFEDSQYSS